MNKAQRKRLEVIHDLIDGLVSEMSVIADQEKEKYNNAPENLQLSDRVVGWLECADEIHTICDDIGNALEKLMSEVIEIS